MENRDVAPRRSGANRNVECAAIKSRRGLCGDIEIIDDGERRIRSDDGSLFRWRYDRSVAKAIGAGAVRAVIVGVGCGLNSLRRSVSMPAASATVRRLALYDLVTGRYCRR